MQLQEQLSQEQLTEEQFKELKAQIFYEFINDYEQPDVTLPIVYADYARKAIKIRLAQLDELLRLTTKSVELAGCFPLNKVSWLHCINHARTSNAMKRYGWLGGITAVGVSIITAAIVGGITLYILSRKNIDSYQNFQCEDVIANCTLKQDTPIFSWVHCDDQLLTECDDIYKE